MLAVGLGCRAQVVFKQGGLLNDDTQSYSYSVIGILDGKKIDLPQDKLGRDASLGAVNATAGPFRGAYALQSDPDYSLLPIFVSGCQNGIIIKEFQVKASKAGKPDWFSPVFNQTSAALPDQVTQLKAVRGPKQEEITVSWTASENTYSTIEGAFVVAGEVGKKDRLRSVFVEDKQKSVTLFVGLRNVNVTVLRYNNANNGALSDVVKSPQVYVPQGIR
jgi:hypothetical protein